MKVKIPIYQYVKELKEDNEFELPDEESYYFETGIRRSIRFIPIWTTWKCEKGEDEIIFQYHITVVYKSFKNKVESFLISATSGLSDLFKEEDKSEKASIIQSLFKGWLDKRTKEQFEADLNSTIENFNNFE
jgi:hypothetical protein